jgi:hypothetical protein
MNVRQSILVQESHEFLDSLLPAAEIAKLHSNQEQIRVASSKEFRRSIWLLLGTVSCFEIFPCFRITQTLFIKS